MLTANDYVGKVRVLLNNGAGAFTLYSTAIATGANTFDVAAGDFDGDGDLDVAAVRKETPGKVAIALNRGGSPNWLGFEIPTIVPLEAAAVSPQSIVTGDFDGDGDLDLATANTFGDNVSVLFGNGAGSFALVAQSPFAIGQGLVDVEASDIAVGDFNSDGRPDLAVAAGPAFAVSILLNTGGTNAQLSFQLQDVAFCTMAGEGLVSVDVGDLDHDGGDDILLLSQVGARAGVIVLRNLGGQGEGWLGFAEERVFPSFGTNGGRWAITAADIDGDGFADALVTDRSGGYLYGLINDRTGEFGAPFQWTVGGYNPEGLTTGRFNGDNLLDVAVARYSSNYVVVRLNLTSPPTSLDLDGNGVPDECVCVPSQIALAEPPHGVLDARQPYAPSSTLPRQGIGAPGGQGSAREPITITLDPAVAGLEECFELCETVPDSLLGPNSIESVTYLGDGRYEIVLNHAITAGGVATIDYLDYTGGTVFVEYTAHPANVDADGASGPVDILALIDILNLVRPAPWGNYSCDLDRSNVCGPADILRVIDLLNGADEFDPWLGVSRPVNNSCPPSEGFAGAGGAIPESGTMPSETAAALAQDTEQFIDGFVSYLATSKPLDSAADAEFKLVVEALTGFCVQNLSPEERAKLAERLQDPSLTFASDTAAAMIPEIVASLTK